MSKKSNSFTNNFKLHKYVPVLGLACALVLVGTASAVISKQRTEQAHLETIELPKNLSAIISVDEMKTKAIALAPSGTTIVGIELETEHDSLFYKVKFSDGSFKLFSAKTGELATATDDSEIDESVPADFVSGITLDQAREVALKQFPGKTITKIELETENGIVVYSVKFSDDSRVDVNAKTGDIVRTKDADNNTEDTNSSDDSNDDSDDDSSRNSGDDSDNDSNDDSDSKGQDDNSESGSNSGKDSEEDNN